MSLKAANLDAKVGLSSEDRTMNSNSFAVMEAKVHKVDLLVKDLSSNF